MRAIHYFNPENDMALAYGGANYTPTPQAAQLKCDLALLPAWLAESGDGVVCDDERHAEWLSRQGLGVDAVPSGQLQNLQNCRIVPWGWSLPVRNVLLRKGVDACRLPSETMLTHWRELSHRRLTIAIHRRLKELLGKTLAPMPTELSSIEDVRAWAKEHPRGFLKMPWSGSGQGVYQALDVNDDYLWKWVGGALRRQQSLLCELPLDVLMDFAVEMNCLEGKTHVTGYSVFESDRHNQYACGVVDGQKELRGMIEAQYPQLPVVEQVLVTVLNELVAPHYAGVLGVDMLLYRVGAAQVGIDPCVEVNLRTTMGMVTAALGEKHGLRGRFVIEKVDSDFVPSGHLLTPHLPDTRYVAMVL
ncbi:MAG: hypothetical protein IJ808_05210 [Muribaculaceae bacterium]|nr:hypothetical protein [Muribaculaceae bacterium]